MELTRNDISVEMSSRPTNRCSYKVVIGTLCLLIATIAFFGSVATIVWFAEHKVAYKYSVMCFMVGSGILYCVAFTSSLVLLTMGHSRKSSLVSREESHVGATSFALSDEGCEAASDISYRGNYRLLQLPQLTNVAQTPPPPYKDPPKISSADQVLSTQDSNSRTSLNRFYYELNRDEVPEREQVARPCPMPVASGFDIEMQPMKAYHTRSFNNSNLLTNALKQQVASNSSLPIKIQGGEFRESLQNHIGNSKHQGSISSENSPRPGQEGERNPTQVAKRKLKATMWMSHPDLLREGSGNSRCSLNPEGKSSRSDCNADTRSLQSNLNSQGPQIIPRPSAEGASQSILNFGGRQRDLLLDCDEDIQSSQSLLNTQGMSSRLPKSNPETRTSLTSSNLQGTPRILGSNAESRTSPSNFTPEKRRGTRLDLNVKPKLSPTNLKPEGTISNIIRRSQMNLAPGNRLQTSQHSVNVDIERAGLKLEDQKQESLSNLNSKQNQFDSKVSSDRRFTSQSNMHLNTQQSNSNAYSYGLQNIPQADMNSSSSLNIPRLNKVDVDPKHTSQPVRRFQKLSQPQKFVASSSNISQLQKAQSFTSLSETNQLPQAETIPTTTCTKRLPNVSSTQVSGRSVESVLDATSNNKQMTSEEWMAAWNRGFHKLPTKESDQIVGVRI